MKGGKKVRKTCTKWVKPKKGFYKFNVDGTTRGKPRLVRIKGVLHDDLSRMLLIFLESVGIMESNEAELRAIR